MGAMFSNPHAVLTLAYARKQKDGEEAPHSVHTPDAALDAPAAIDADQELMDALALIAPQLSASLDLSQSEEQRLATDPEIEQLSLAQMSPHTVVAGCSHRILRISRNIGLLYHTTTLQLCCNLLTEIPAEIGYLRKLKVLSIAQNKVKTLPDTIGLLTELIELKINNNQIIALPPSIGALTKLTTFSAGNNKISFLPNEIGNLKSLASFDISNNPIEYIPAEVGRLRELRRINVNNCPLVTTTHVGQPNLPTLKELAARTIVRLQLPILSITQPELKDYLASSHECSYCGGPYFESYATYVRLVERGNAVLPLQYRLCVRHWTTEQQRIVKLFCPLPSTAPSPIPSAIATPAQTPPGSPDSRHRKGSLAALPLTSISKSPSLPSLPQASELAAKRKRSESNANRKSFLKASNMRPSRSLSFLSMPSGANMP